VQKKFIITYLIIFVTLLIMMSLSRHTSEKMRGHSVAVMTPLWEKFLALKHYLLHPSQPLPFSHLSIEEEKQRLQLENQLLETELTYLRKQLNEQLLISSQIAQIAPLASKEASTLASDYQKSLQRTYQIMQRHIQALPARVIFRSFDTWNSFLWINIGESTNQSYSSKIVALNSPVIIGKAIVGVIDHVGEHQSRVRLISDNRLTPSVRASRGGEQDFLMSEQIERLLQHMNHKKGLPLSLEEKNQLAELLQKLKQHLQPFKKTWYLAKGELLGSTFSAKLGQNIYLKGTGFNYDFADEEGENRDLRSGKSMQNSQAQTVPILKVNDILVTTGMDGIFPPGFQVAIVTRVGLLKEGDYFYDLEARPIAGPLDELALVFVLPPLQEKNESEEIK
jgi:rod shape-determining protein MreC